MILIAEELKNLHYFNVFVAKDVGINAAVLLQNIKYWVDFNEEKGSNMHYQDGKWWMFNSVEGFHKNLFYLTPNQIRTAIDRLEKSGFIEIGNFNRMYGDRTKWYTYTERTSTAYHSICEISQMDLGKNPNGIGNKSNSICEEIEMDLGKNPNGIGKKPTPIPNINTDIDANIKSDEKQQLKDKTDIYVDSETVDTISNSKSEDSISDETIYRIVYEWSRICDYTRIKPIKDIDRQSVEYNRLYQLMKAYKEKVNDPAGSINDERVIDVIVSGIKKITNSRTLTGYGEGNAGKAIDFSWFVKRENFNALMNGEYDMK